MVLQEHYTLYCIQSNYYILFVIVTTVFKIFLHIIGLLLAFLTRKIKVEALNESKYTAAMVYYSSFLVIFASIILELTKDSDNLRKPFWAFVITAVISVFLGLTFIPKVSVLCT